MYPLNQQTYFNHCGENHIQPYYKYITKYIKNYLALS